VSFCRQLHDYKKERLRLLLSLELVALLSLKIPCSPATKDIHFWFKMSVVFTQTLGVDYTPNYLFVSGDCQRGTGKSRHVMKEFLRKRDSIRRQKQLASRSKSRVLPWLRREDMEQNVSQTVGSVVDAALSSDSLSETSSRPSSPQQSQSTAGSTVAESHASPSLSSSGSNLEFGGFSDTTANTSHIPRDLVTNCKSSNASVRSRF
jgi:hypothetical protein